MRCPACTEPLVATEIEDIEVDYCADGHGLWLDEGELEALTQSTDRLVPTGAQNAKKGPRRCPRCRARMLLWNPEEDLQLDRCPYGDGLWFDPGELERLVKAFQKKDADGALGGALARVQRLLGGA